LEIPILEAIPFKESHLRGWWDGEYGVVYCRIRKTLISIDLTTIISMLGEPTNDAVVLENIALISDPDQKLPDRLAPEGFAPEILTSEHSAYIETPLNRQFCTPFVCFNLYVDTDSILLDQIAELFLDLPKQDSKLTNHFLNIFIKKQTDTWAIYVDDKSVINGLERAQVAPFVIDLAMAAYYRNTDFKYAFHGAGLQWLSHNLYFPAISGSGKSTLFAHLIELGAIPLSDEVVSLNEEFQPSPIPFPMTLKQGSWALFPKLKPFSPIWRRGESRLLKYYPLDWSESLPNKPALIIFPKYSEHGQESITSVTPCQAMYNLSSNGYELYQQGNEQMLDALLHWLDSIPLLEISYPNSESAERLIRRAINESKIS